MKEEDRLELIRELQEKGYKRIKPQSMVLNNFYALVTIIVVVSAISIYINFIIPQKAKKDQEELIKKEREEYLLMRKKQIELSRKLNSKSNPDARLQDTK